MLFLKQSTASQSVIIGPFLDSTDGNTQETGLTIANTDIRLSKNGGNLAAKNSGGATHDEEGFYTITLDATDTNTVGRLQLFCHIQASALPVYREYQVLEEAIYDALFGASAAGFNASAEVTVGTNNDKTGYTASTVSDKTGYSLTATTGLGNQTANITGNLSGSVGSVTGAVGSVTGAVGSVTAGVSLAAGAITDASLAGNMEVVFETDFATNYNATRNAWVTNTQDTVGTGSFDTATGFATPTNITAGTITTVSGNVDGSVGSVTGAVGSVTAEVTADIAKISGSATAADNLELSALTIIPFTVTGTPTSTEVAATGLTAITGGDDVLIGRVIIFTSGNAQYEAARITDYVDATGAMTVTALAITPAATDTGIII